MSQNKSVIFIFLFIVLFMYGCKENVLINSKVSPANDTLGVFQTNLVCITHTFFDDSIATSSSFPGVPMFQSLGVITDPFFGTMTSSTYFQIIPAENGFTFPTGSTVDSAILILPYSGFTWGDTTNHNTQQSYQVFYLNDSLGNIITTTYYPFNTKEIDMANPLSNPTSVNVYHISDSFFVAGKNHASIRIKLNLSTFMSKLNNALNICSASSNPSEQLFIQNFNGICVRPADTRLFATSMPYIQLDGSDPYSQAGVLVYYHVNVGDTTFEQFYFNTTYCTHFNGIANSYGHYPVNNLYSSKQSNDAMIAISNQPGAGIDIKIAGITNLPKGIINKAELQLTLLPEYNNSAFISPQKIYATGIATSTYPAGLGYVKGEKYNLADRYPLFSLSPFNVLDGYPHTNIKSGYTIYTLDIPRELMQAIAQKSDTIHLYLNGTEDYYGAYHMVVAGANYSDSTLRAKFKVVYSQLK